MRYLLLLLIVACGYAADDVVLGLGPVGLQQTNPTLAPMGLYAGTGLGVARTTTQAIAAASFTNLNDAALTTYTSTTGRWDPVNNAIKYANQRRQRTFTINGTNYSADLIESARTNLLASGTSEHFERWTVGSGTPVVTTDTIACPNAEVVADTLTEGVGTGTQGVSQSVTKAASSLAYVGSCYIKNKTGSREVAVDLDDGTLTNGVQMRINPATGAVTSAPAAFGTGWAVNTTAGTSGYTIESAGSGWYRVSIIATSDATTTVRFRVALYNAADSYAGDGTSAVYLWGADANQATFAASVCLCRNMALVSETFDNSGWSKTRSTVVANAVADPLTGNLTADRLVEDATAGATHIIGANATIAKAASSLTITNSVYALAGERTWCVVAMGLSTTLTNGCGAYFDLGNGATGATLTNGAGWTLVSKTITSVGGGWYRCAVTLTTDTGTTMVPVVRIATADNTSSYNGDITKGIYLWGEDVEYGSAARQYWATTTAGLRTADVLLSTLTSITDARTNLLTWSEQFDNAAWTKTDTTITANATTDPNGNSYADLATEGSAGTATVSQSDAGFSAGATVTGSIFMKYSDTAWARVRVAGGSDSWETYFNLQTGAAGTTTIVGTSTLTAAGVVSYGNGWYRCWTTGVVNNSSTTLSLRTISASSDGGSRQSGSNRYIFGAQLVPSATLTDYIPVGGTAITTGPTGLSRTTGTLVSIVMPRNWTGDQDGATAYRIFGGNDTNLSGFRRNNATTVFGARGDVGGNEFNAPASSTPTNGALTLYSVTWSPSAVNAGYNGATFAQDATLQAPFDAVTSASLGAVSSGVSAVFGYSLHLYSHQQVVPGSTLALMYAGTTAP